MRTKLRIYNFFKLRNKDPWQVLTLKAEHPTTESYTWEGHEAKMSYK